MPGRKSSMCKSQKHDSVVALGHTGINAFESGRSQGEGGLSLPRARAANVYPERGMVTDNVKQGQGTSISQHSDDRKAGLL